MFNKPEIEKRKAILTIGDTEYCSINIKGSRTLTNTCIRLQDCMNKIAQWKRPNLQLFFSSGDGVCGLVTAEDMLFVVYMENEEQKIKKLDGTTFGLSENADLEELLFILAKQLIRNVRNDPDSWVDSMLVSNSSYPKEKLEEKKKSFKRAMLRVLDTLEETEIEAEKQYRIPEFLKGLLIWIANCSTWSKAPVFRRCFYHTLSRIPISLR